jgi:hypothetical protein
MAAHKVPASSRPRCTRGGSHDANLPSTTDDTPAVISQAQCG